MTEENKTPYLNPQETVKDTNYLLDIFADMSKRFGDELEHAQGRSNFQIEKYVSGTEFTLSSTYKHTMKNASIMRKELFRTIKEGIENQREFELKWNGQDKTKPIEWKTKDGGVKNCWYDLDELDQQVYMNDLACGIKDKVQQLAFFDQVLNALIEKNGGPITREQFDAEEPVYWERRMQKQIMDDVLSRVTGVNGGNIDSTRQAAAPVLIPGSINQVKTFPALDLLLPGENQNLGAFLAKAQAGLNENYLDVSKEYNNAAPIASQPNVDTITQQPAPTQNPNDLLKSLGIGSIDK